MLKSTFKKISARARLILVHSPRYKEETEFYRFTPPDPMEYDPVRDEQRPPWERNKKEKQKGLVQTWKVPGIKVDVS